MATQKPKPTTSKKGNRTTWRLPIPNGKFHRTDGPAIEHSNGRKEWFVEGKRHRTDGPAIEYSNGRKDWYVDGVHLFTMTLSSADKIVSYHPDGHLVKFHRTNGPEVEFPEFPEGVVYWKSAESDQYGVSSYSYSERYVVKHLETGKTLRWSLLENEAKEIQRRYLCREIPTTIEKEPLP